MRTTEVLDLYLVQLRGDGRSVHTIRQAARFVRKFAAHTGDQPIEQIGHETVAAYLASDAVTRRSDGGLRKANSANAVRSVLRGFFAFATGAGFIRTNPARLVRRAKCAPPKPRAVPPSDAQLVLAALEGARTAAEKRDRAMTRLMLGIGLRVGSVVALDVRDVDFSDASIRVRTLKGGDADTLFLSDDLVRVLREHVGERTTGPLFAGPGGRPIGTRQVARRLSMWARRAGIERRVNPHGLRQVRDLRFEVGNQLFFGSSAHRVRVSVWDGEMLWGTKREPNRAAPGQGR